MDIDDDKIVIGDIPLKKISRVKKINERSLVPVGSTNSNLRSLALAVATGTPVLLQGPVGCGKTALVEHLAQVTGRLDAKRFIKVHLGDQTDSKLLLGTYCCTEVPGEFVWQPGSLTQAVTNGYWLLLEDLDFAPTDVLSVLVPLLESRTLLLPGRGGEIKAADGFHLFATQRLSVSGFKAFQQSMSTTNITEKLWSKLNVEPLSQSELKEVIETKWPVLSLIAPRILEVYFTFSSGQHELSLDATNEIVDISDVDRLLSQEGRLISTRDLFKWCARIAPQFDISSKSVSLEVFQDALDCFCASIPKPEVHLKGAEAIGARFNITKSKAEFYCQSYKPHFQVLPTDLSIGRAKLSRKNTEKIILSRIKSTFSFTRPSLTLLERIAVAVGNKEPVLLVGETGTGKTATVQFLAEQTGNKLVVINMNQQSDSTDLLGGYKPVEFKYLVSPVRDEFEEIFCEAFSREENAKFLSHVQICINRQRWSDLFALMLHCRKKALKEKRGKIGSRALERWEILGEKIRVLQAQLRNATNALAFSFVEGSLVKAIRDGCWLLLDEINLATPETLECLSGLLENIRGSVLLLEKGEVEPVPRHENFHLFACMNPATDVGKKDLPLGVRNRFTEFFVDELEDAIDLRILVSDYLNGLSLTVAHVNSIVSIYLDLRKLARTKLVDGTGQKPHYSLRTFCRALSYAATNSAGSVPRSLYEAFCLSFLTQLDTASHDVVTQVVVKQLLGKNKEQAILKQPLPEPKPSAGKHILVEGYWVSLGDLDPKITDDYVLTPTIRRNLYNLVRIIAARKHPVLLQGDTSVGKTSLITYVAKLTGNHCVRINNHEHTDLQEYVGSYASDSSGRLIFKEGVLVSAMRKGHWVILDELNLAPSEVLEALNRVLDDNRELHITETQETVRAHPRFMLFATQNPPGQYGGRKMLSRAFRNRFIELHFTEIPPKELEMILHERCAVPLSYCKKLVAVMMELQARRKGSSVFAGKQGFITLRDLFRWGERYKQAPDQTTKFYDWDQHLADEGYILLAGRSRRTDEDAVIRLALQKHLKRVVDPQRLFTLDENTSTVTRLLLESVLSSRTPGFQHVVWTYNMRRLAVLVGKTLQFKEPVLLVGETGCGKTTICQMFSQIAGNDIHSLNCHMHSECADFLGGLRPVRTRSRTEDPEEQHRLFEWVDGPLINAMNSGSYFLADEISLAEDSVLERLNSVLESERSLLVAEKGAGDEVDSEYEVVVAQPGFHFMATMNPGGDYGKKELSPALRNRLTELWCPSYQEQEDLLRIIEHNLDSHVFLCNQEDGTSGVGHAMVAFLDYFAKNPVGQKCTVSVRDILSWVQFVNVWSHSDDLSVNDVAAAFVHGACLVFLDSIGTTITGSFSEIELTHAKNSCVHFLLNYMGKVSGIDISGDKLRVLQYPESDDGVMELESTRENHFGIHPFYVKKGPMGEGDLNGLFTFSSISTRVNTQRVLRAMQLEKPILLEGSPGVGKTSLVSALAKASGHQLVRINLSEQTDISDLFGADLPVEGSSGHFAWRDGPLLKALKAGHWVVFDEMNLASQSVLEGLNACLDHRGAVFVPELGCSFQIKSRETRIFACQNPIGQGGGRKGLPRSFVNRFTQVFVEPLTEQDLEFITTAMFPVLPERVVRMMVTFNQKIHRSVVVERQWGLKGSPWEFNLRDVFRWAELIVGNQRAGRWEPAEFVYLVYGDRMRSESDKQKMMELFRSVFGDESIVPLAGCGIYIGSDRIQVGRSSLPRNCRTVCKRDIDIPKDCHLLVLRRQLPALESLMTVLQHKWMAILVGPKSSGKTSIVKALAQLTGQELRTVTLNSATDTMDLLGGFEQNDIGRKLEDLENQLDRVLRLGNQSTPTGNGFLRVTNTQEITAWKGRAQKLKETVTNLDIKNPENSKELEAIISKLNSIDQEIKIREQTPTKLGGQFEWVDSVLVQAVRDGHWLLLDNVNFCSPSVLDRLNGLLEPNGVLTINERGVVDGDIPTIPQHPNFRLILAMDPRNGEISRAMRNRGVEIYIGEDESTDGQVLDVHQMLMSRGVRNLELQRVLIDVHSSVVERSIGWEKPDRVDLFRCAFLTAQQIGFGVREGEAVVHSCVDVYVRGLRNREKKREVMEVINQRLELAGDLREETCSWFLPSIGDYVRDSEHARVMSDGVVIECLCRKMAEVNGGRREFAGFYVPEVENLKDYVDPAVKLFLLKCSQTDLGLRLKFLKDLAGKLNGMNVIDLRKRIEDWSVNGFNDRMILKIRECGIDELPLDLRWLPGLLKTVMMDKRFRDADWDLIFGEVCSLSNKLLLWMDFVSRRAPGRTDVGDDIVRDVNRLIPLLGDHFLELVTSNMSCDDDDKLDALQGALRWLQRFDRVANGRGTKSLLAVHWVWFEEKCLTVLSTEPYCFGQKVDVIRRKIDGRLKMEVVDGYERCEFLRGEVGAILPFRSMEQWEMMQEVNGLSNQLDVWSTNDRTDLQTRSLKFHEGDVQMKLTLREAFKGIIENFDINLVRGTISCLKTDIGTANGSKIPIGMLLITEHVTRLQETAVLSALNGGIKDPDLLLRLSGQLLWTTVGPIHAGVYLIAAQAIKEGRGLIHEIPRITIEYYDHLERSAVLYGLEESGSMNEGLDEHEGSRILASALMSRAASRMLLSGVDENPDDVYQFSSGLKLGSCTEKVKMLSDLSSALWRNASAFAAVEYDVMANERKLLVEAGWRFFSSVVGFSHRMMVTEKMSIRRLGDAAKSCLKKDLHDAVDCFVGVVDAGSFAELGRGWTALGLIKVSLLSSLGPMDDAERKGLALQYCKEELAELERELHVYDWMLRAQTGLTMSDVPDQQQHPHLISKIKRVSELKREIMELEKDVAIRPTHAQFDGLSKELAHFVKSIGSRKTVWGILMDLVIGSRSGIEKQRGWRAAALKFVRNVKEQYPMYCDLWSPLVIAVYQLIHGTELLVHAAEKMLNGFEEIGSVMSCAVFPWIDAANPSAVELIRKILLPGSRKGLAKVKTVEFSAVKSLNGLLLKSGLLEVYNSVVTSSRMNTEQAGILGSVLKEFVLSWNQQEEERTRRQMEKESLYQFRSHCDDLPEAEQDNADFNKLFPTYGEEFNNLNPDEEIESSEVDSENAASENLGPIDESMMEMVCKIHGELMVNFTHARWLKKADGLKGVSADYVKAFLPRYCVAMDLVKDYGSLIDYTLDQRSLGGHLVAGQVLQGVVNREESGSKRIYDVYHDPNIAEAKLCRPILEEMMKRMDELLSEWPDHPTLIQITEVIKLILDFPVASPLMKFITGLEFLLSKAQEWERNAHKGVSLMVHLEKVTQQVISWRKMELKWWSACLDTVARKQVTGSAKWWFHTYVLIDGYRKDTIPMEEFIQTLQQFLEKSTLGEFSTRLGIILGFHCQMIHEKKSPKQKELLTILWNLHKYYSMFMSAVEKKITALRKPIEKQVKNYVKIARWNDLNFWAVKESVEKSHRTLHKHMKAFEKILREPVRLAMTNPVEFAPATNERKLNLPIDVHSFVASLKLKDRISEMNLQFVEPNLLSRLPKLFQKVRRFSRRFVQSAPYSELIEDLEELTGDVISSANDLQALTVNANSDKDKQKSEAKSIHTRKRKALSDLFKILTKIGISYRKGLMLWKENKMDSFLHLPPTDLEASVNFVDPIPADEYLTASWSGCTEYLNRGVARLALLHSVAQEPHKDLGIGNLDRIFGFPSHLGELSRDQMKIIANLDESYRDLRILVDRVREVKVDEIPVQGKTRIAWRDAVKLADDLAGVLEQFSILLQCAPECHQDICPDSRVLPYDSADGFRWTKENGFWSDAVKMTRDAAVEVKTIQNDLLKMEATSNLVTRMDVCLLEGVFERFSEIDGTLTSLIAAFGQRDGVNSFTRSLEFVGLNLKRLLERRLDRDADALDAGEEDRVKLNRIVEKLVRKILIGIQKVVKETPEEMKSTDDEPDNYLRDCLMKDLNEKIGFLQLKQTICLTKKTADLLSNILDSSVPTDVKLNCVQLISSVHPILTQYCQLTQFLFVELVRTQRSTCKLNSILLGIFIELVSKGFCVPQESEDDVGAGDGATEFKDITGGGLGEGEGVKDVSDRLESEDQLEDARPEGEEKKDEDGEKPDVKEEENGIEMSEDFEGKMHDLDENEENSDEDDDEEEEEIDKQMGDLGDEKDPETMDEKMWGSDSEDEDDEDDGSELEDEYGPGAEKEKERLVAKDDNKDKRTNDEEDEKNDLNDEDGEDEDINPYDDTPCDDKLQSPKMKDEKTEEPEPMDIPEKMVLDGGDDGDEDEEAEPEDGEDEKPEPEDGEDEKLNDGSSTEELEAEEEEAKDGGDSKDEVQEKPMDVDEEEKDPGIEEENLKSILDEDETSQSDDATPEGEDQCPSKNERVQAAENESKASKDKCQQQILDASGDAAPDDDRGEDGDEGEESVGAAMTEKDGGKIGRTSKQPPIPISDRTSEPEMRLQFQRRSSNRKRTLGDATDVVHKRLRTIEDENEGVNPEEVEPEMGNLFEHVTKDSEKAMQTTDSATLEEAKEQAQVGEDSNDDDDDVKDGDVLMHQDEDKEEEKPPRRDAVPPSIGKKDPTLMDSEADADGDDVRMNASGEKIVTFAASRGPESTIHTNMNVDSGRDGCVMDVEEVRRELEKHLADWNRRCEAGENGDEALKLWREFEAVTLPLARELCEQLRLVLEPTLAAKLKGDYRTGKRLNMRKVIPYIASQFRKDKIWMRRTKPNKREYQILVAVDDSSSMADNHVKELAFESLAVISKALSLLEAGEIGIANFGADFSLLHPFHEQFDDSCGARTLRMFSFEQKKTDVARMLDSATNVMVGSRVRSAVSLETAQLLVIISDGRGLYSEGVDVVKAAIRRARNANVFVVFIVLDLATNKNSIFDTRVPVFKDGLVHEIRSYMDDFPFPFYVVLQEVSSLPAVLSDALRQWFELVTSAE